MHRALGNPEAAWRLVSNDAGPDALTDRELLALQPYYDALYGQSPTYRAYMSRIARKP